jgi:hypothetical protein
MSVELRRTSIEALRGFRPFGMTFSGRGDGYALFARCDAAVNPPCEARLFATEDNGKTWTQRTLPVTRARSWGVGIAKIGESRLANLNIMTWRTYVVVRADPVGWLVSADGRAFTLLPLTPEPYEVSLLRGEFHARCPDGSYHLEYCTPEVVRVTWRGTLALAVQPPIPGYISSVKASDDGSVWAASFYQGRAFTAVSRDEGATWLTHDVPALPNGIPVQWAEVFPAYDRTAWLSGTHPDAVTKPRLWFLSGLPEDGGWALADVDLPSAYTPSFVNFGGGPLGISGFTAPNSFSVSLRQVFVDHGVSHARVAPLRLPAGVRFSDVLPGGPVLATGEQWPVWPNDVWLGLGHYDERHWLHIVIGAPA